MKLRYVAGIVMGLLATPVAGLAISGSLSGPDLGERFEYIPLVRHQISQRHCYDDGTFFCETPEEFKPAFQKEFTLGFLFDGIGLRRFSPLFAPVYSCLERGATDTGKYMVTAGTVDTNPDRICRKAGLKPYFLGYIANFSNFEAATPLYRCTNVDKTDVLLTDDPAECTAVSYSAAQQLGWITYGSSLPLR